jgi:hypothetical protein
MNCGTATAKQKISNELEYSNQWQICTSELLYGPDESAPLCKKTTMADIKLVIERNKKKGITQQDRLELYLILKAYYDEEKFLGDFPETEKTDNVT